jgi:hypothetical protein
VLDGVNEPGCPAVVGGAPGNPPMKLDIAARKRITTIASIVILAITVTLFALQAWVLGALTSVTLLTVLIMLRIVGKGDRANGSRRIPPNDPK